MLSDALLHALVTSRDADVTRLGVEVSGLWSTARLDHLMDPLPWSVLTSQGGRKVEVTLTISSDVPAFALGKFLVPEIPLAAITFDINCHCYRKAIVLLHQYSDTLR